MAVTIPLFPLNTVLYPGGPLPLRVFEPRYLDMISNCLKHDSGIGVVLIRNGKETGPAPDVYKLGTLAKISYWHKRSDGMLGVTLTGEQRFRIISTQVEKDQLMLAEIELLQNPQTVTLPDKYGYMPDMLQQIIPQLSPPFSTMTCCYDDTYWVCSRLIELLPLTLEEKQSLLNVDDINVQIERLDTLIKQARL